MRLLLVVFGALQVLTGVLLWLAPGFFHEWVGPYGPRNDHYMGDLATWYLALGVVVLVAVRRASWRPAVLALGLMQYTLHTVNHLLDIGETDPGWLGPVNFVSIALLAVLLAWMLRATREQAR
jgi:hypothetical protein